MRTYQANSSNRAGSNPLGVDGIILAGRQSSRMSNRYRSFGHQLSENNELFSAWLLQLHCPNSASLYYLSRYVLPAELTIADYYDLRNDYAIADY